MRTTFAVAAVSALVVLTVTDAASAGIFRRMWERRKAELRGEMSGYVNHQVDAAATQLSADLDDKLESETSKLEQEISDHLAVMRTEAMQFLALEAEKLETQLTSEVAKLKREAEEKVAAEASRLREEVDQQVTRMQESADARLVEVIKQFDTRADQQLALVSKNAEDSIAAELARIRTETEKTPEDEPAPSTPNEQAIQTPPVELKEEEKG